MILDNRSPSSEQVHELRMQFVLNGSTGRRVAGR